MKTRKQLTRIIVISAIWGLIILVQVVSGTGVNGNILYLEPGQRIYVSCEIDTCEGVRFGKNNDGKYVEGILFIPAFNEDSTPTPSTTITPTLAATSTATQAPPPPPESTLTPSPTNTPIPVDTATPFISEACVQPGELADFENWDLLTGTWNIREAEPFVHNGLYPISPETVDKTFEPLTADASNILQWCFGIGESDEYAFEITALGPNIKSDSFWMSINGSDPLLIPFTAGNYITFNATARGSSSPVSVFAEAGDIVDVAFYPRESGALLYSVKMISFDERLNPPTVTPTQELSTPPPNHGCPQGSSEYPEPCPTNPYP